ncbi:MAG: hypothetical protein M1828_002022 [Chrysothrix sp. TS-e1954]|nr:MAG: hypothetical protein M1828_002022 [Chrysothrix sp. TS-e1954]
MSTTNGNLEPTIRHATIEDAPTILAMIKELADFERKADQVKATEASIRSTLTFDPSPSNPLPKPGFAKCFLLIVPPSTTAAPTSSLASSHVAPENVAAMALYTFNYSTWVSQPGVYLEDLFVRPQYRRRGYAKMLFGALARASGEIAGGNETRMKWTCLKWNEGALAFYEGLGASKEDEWHGLRVEGESLRKLAEQ